MKFRILHVQNGHDLLLKIWFMIFYKRDGFNGLTSMFLQNSKGLSYNFIFLLMSPGILLGDYSKPQERKRRLLKIQLFRRQAGWKMWRSMGFKGTEKTRNELPSSVSRKGTLPETTSNFRTWKVTENPKGKGSYSKHPGFQVGTC